MAQAQKPKTRIPHVLDDPGSSGIAKVYAQSFLDAAASTGMSEPLVEFTSFVNDVLEQNAEFEQLLTASTLTSAQRVELIDRIVAPSSSELFASFLRVLARHDRLMLLRSILHFSELEQEHREGKRRVKITTARDLSSTAREKIERSLLSALSFKPVLETRSDSRLIGGMVIQIGDKVYDGSLRTRLNNLRDSLRKRSLHEIQSGRDRFSHPEGD
ncbi:MAG: ATP synthase F1 subunit delta [Planctomycetaceae bacterium]